jgi:hypothetical protein
MRRPVLAIGSAAVLALLTVLAPPSATAGPSAWASVTTASIRPGVPVSTETGGCTSNFVFTERRTTSTGTRTDVLLGLAAHCFSLGDASQTDCTTPSRGIGSRAVVQGARYPATLVYSSWRTAQTTGERNVDACLTNDFALVRLDPRDHGRVNPSLLYFGGPHGVRGSATGVGDLVHTYGSSSLRLGVTQLSPKRGTATGTTNSGWNHRVYTATPGVPGDSGSAVLDESGRALGILVTLEAAPFPASNGVTDLAKALSYARGKTGRDYRLANGTQPFRDPLVP